MNALKGDRIDRVGRRGRNQACRVGRAHSWTVLLWDTVLLILCEILCDTVLLWQSVNVTHCSSNILWHTVFLWHTVLLCACHWMKHWVCHTVCQCATLYHTAFHHIALCGYSVHTLEFVSIGMSNWIPAHYWSINFLRQRIGQHVSTGCLVLWCFQSMSTVCVN